MPLADLLVGSYPNLEAQTLTITTTGPVTEPHVLPAGDYYLWDELGNDWHLGEAMQTALLAHSVLSDVTCYINESLHFQITSSVSFSMTWPADGILRDLLGFTGSLSPTATTHTATNISPLLWTPGRNNNPTEARRRSDGIPVSDTAVGQSGPGTMRATEFNEYRRNTLMYRYVENSLVWTTAEAGGEFIAFWRNVLRLRRRFKVWHDVPLDFAGSDVLDNDGLGATAIAPATGAYVYSGSNEMPFGREFGYSETRHPIQFPVVRQREYDAP